ncbi:SDR family NAD(P)-dependent oxidoreductase [Chitinophagales bacterium]|nr:SDR family NAD(P)-dependent oxidoreductase [Chitinophagales bacterium]
MSRIKKYGKTACIAGASEGIGAAFSHYLAKEGYDLIVVARRLEPMIALAKEIESKYQVKVDTLSFDLSAPNAAKDLLAAVEPFDIDVLVYNAGLSYIGAFEKNDLNHHLEIARTNIMTPLELLQTLGAKMLERNRGAVVLMGSLAGLQGSGFLSTYAASKAFDTILAESLWYEWKDRGVDVIACVAGATSSPNFINTKPKKVGLIEPKVQTPEEVVEECFANLGKQPRVITGFANRLASFFMHRVLPRKLAVKIMGDTTRKMYGV